VERFRKRCIRDGHQLWEFDKGVFGVVVGGSAHRIWTFAKTRGIWWHELARSEAVRKKQGFYYRSERRRVSTPPKVGMVIDR
jgi:hypothetical protein